MRITKYGHCCLLIDIGGVRFLTDPGAFGPESILKEKVEDLDAILITHEHADHLHVDSLKEVLKNNSNAKVVTNPSVGTILEKEGIEYHSVADGDSIDIKGILVEGMGTKHAIIYQDMGQVENTGYFLNGGDKQGLFYPGDALHLPGKPVDILALPVAGPWMKIGEAVDYALAVRPRVAFPVHDGPNAGWGMFAQWIMPTFLPKEGIQFITIEIGKTQEL
jgi:L-ascorbate metabolism protein UlaG (beta-lactamase superfamily)